MYSLEKIKKDIKEAKKWRNIFLTIAICGEVALPFLSKNNFSAVSLMDCLITMYSISGFYEWSNNVEFYKEIIHERKSVK